jgi:hypothetical protein
MARTQARPRASARKGYIGHSRNRHRRAATLARREAVGIEIALDTIQCEPSARDELIRLHQAKEKALQRVRDEDAREERQARSVKRSRMQLEEREGQASAAQEAAHEAAAAEQAAQSAVAAKLCGPTAVKVGTANWQKVAETGRKICVV